MHEMGLAQNILDIVLRSARQNQASRIVRISVRAGQLRGIVPDQLRFCFGFVAKDSMAEGAELAIQTVPIRAKCKRCSQEFQVEEFRFVCPGCENVDLELLQGKELMIENIEVI
ncbi:MAG: hydrogenase maturation nickel metallochaperone HypA [bacterium]